MSGASLLPALLLLGSCLGGSDGSAVPTPGGPTATVALIPSIAATAAERTPTPTEAVVLTVTTTPSPYPEAARAAIEAAAEEFGVAPDRITVNDYRQVNWPSTALGCPEEGKFYAQIVTPGYEVDLDVAGRQVTYHTNQTGSMVTRCQTAPDYLVRHERHDSKGIWEIVEPVRGEIRATDAYYHVVLERIFPCSEPAFHEPEMQERVWGRRWGVVNDVGTMKLVALHRRP